MLFILLSFSFISCSGQLSPTATTKVSKEVTTTTQTTTTVTQSTTSVTEGLSDEENQTTTKEKYKEIDKISLVLQKVSPSVVNIEFEFDSKDGSNGVGLLSGTIFTNDGYIITVNPNVEKLKKITVTLQDGTQLPGDLIGEDRNTNIAVIKIDAQNPESPVLTSAEDVKVGEIVLSMSRPFGKELNFSQGFVLGTGINITISPDTPTLVDLIKTDTEGKPGTAGGPLVTMEGSIIGINSLMMPSADSEKFSILAMPSDIALNIANQIIKYGKSRIPSIGIEIVANTTNIKGIYVKNVAENSPAIKAGIKIGDIITEFDGVEVKDPFQFIGQILRKNVGDLVQLKIYRDGDYITLDLRLEELEQSKAKK